MILRFYRKVYLSDTEACQGLHLFALCGVMWCASGDACVGSSESRGPAGEVQEGATTSSAAVENGAKTRGPLETSPRLHPSAFGHPRSRRLASVFELVGVTVSAYRRLSAFKTYRKSRDTSSARSVAGVVCRQKWWKVGFRFSTVRECETKSQLLLPIMTDRPVVHAHPPFKCSFII